MTYNAQYECFKILQRTPFETVKQELIDNGLYPAYFIKVGSITLDTPQFETQIESILHNHKWTMGDFTISLNNIKTGASYATH